MDITWRLWHLHIIDFSPSWMLLKCVLQVRVSSYDVSFSDGMVPGPNGHAGRTLEPVSLHPQLNYRSSSSREASMLREYQVIQKSRLRAMIRAPV